VFLGVFYCLRF